MDSSDGWICNSEENCIPFILANKGFDIWLSNSRGNKHSKHHKLYSTLSKEFWSFSFHEMGTKDLPAIIDYIISKTTTNISNHENETDQIFSNKKLTFKKLIYIGHSQGTCMMFAAMSLMPEYFRDRIKLFVALAPVAQLRHMKSSFLAFLKNVKFHKLLKTIEQYEVFPDNEQSNKFNRWINKKVPSLQNLILEMISDDNIKHVNNNSERLGVYLSHYPAGTSLKAINHFIQNIESKTFSEYDYKWEANMRIYGQPTPIEYDLSKISGIPIALLGGKEDKLASHEDLEWLREQLRESIIYYSIYEKMGHLSFLLSKDMSWFQEVLILIEVLSNEDDFNNLNTNNDNSDKNEAGSLICDKNNLSLSDHMDNFIRKLSKNKNENNKNTLENQKINNPSNENFLISCKSVETNSSKTIKNEYKIDSNDGNEIEITFKLNNEDYQNFKSIEIPVDSYNEIDYQQHNINLTFDRNSSENLNNKLKLETNLEEKYKF